MTDFTQADWIFEPKNHEVNQDRVVIVTDPETDFWQRSYYGFRNDNAPGLLLETSENFSFTVKVAFQYQAQFDQCGVLVYLDSDNWFKASIEYENDHFSRLGSVVTNLGYSDWATTDIELPDAIWYRLSRRGPDFLIESSLDGVNFKQMRIFHLHKLGETTPQMGRCAPPMATSTPVRFGLYACSPLNSSFKAEFTEMQLGPSVWQAHTAE
ncbi:DUF1349 domain-containing protein [Corallincola platygyrae]|uniref:DUF1349 domain-containing protein n=1 Tax=Corallincola platygyrae TaxID=1193278 RepID=A0ABW4XI21_9GAMM